MKKIVKNNIFILFILIYASTILSEKAFVTVPVVDLFGQKNNPNDVPLSGGTLNFYESCPRIHQIVLHEIVDIITEDQSGHTHISIPNVYYNTDTNEKFTKYWVLSRALRRIKSSDHDKLPSLISFENQSNNEQLSSAITLIFPFYNPTTNTTCSAGTRLVEVPHKMAPTVPEKHTAVYIFNKNTDNFEISAVPNSLLMRTTNQTPQEKIALFVKILKSWANATEGFIPYVLGGCSFTRRLQPEPFYETRTDTGSFFSYSQTNSSNPKTGFDCSNIISRAAQIAGIPYFLKNSKTVEQNLRPLTAHDILQEGDIIWIPGHVMIVSNVKKNLLIEASSYNHGCGKVHEIPIKTVFHTVKTYKDLIKKHLNGVKIQRINSFTHQIEEPFIPVKLLKIDSVWENTK